ncbi:lipid IV(A) 3-deoxy-D-manno-octulosonic acid transferase [Nitrococcus mobilis]|uniref:3-deoxy-D-manno-octulosonic acid transferase n=1 Tax=Nitrococcus mobilis Nb-231 TaxID=314278 RepID=A4BV05_9GAMM|nr:lipid IV(A) 3-deoxy-D-manno-octulosonic acid transferase [Nitrococcus mobilis]EAR20426.1 3-deoxy-D-manno-octulosonic-acid transferase [Nitrococcus mobilis Nb-231]
MHWRSLYSILLYLSLPVVLARLLLRSRRAPAYRRRWAERFALIPAIAGRPVWIHAVSVGETVAAAPLIERLLTEHPGIPIVVTTTTPTGSQRVRALLGTRVRHYYAPYDLPDVVARFFRRVAPRLVVVMETEIWPNLLATAQRRGIPVVLANARLSARSAAGYRRVAGLLRPALGAFHTIAAQSEADARRFRTLGAPVQRVQINGNMKFDLEISAVSLMAGHALRAALDPQRPVWIAASTHQGEEPLVLEAQRTMHAYAPQALLILVPRHPERFEAIATLCRRSGLETARRSTRERVRSTTQVYLADTMGELPLLYAAADVAFVGGSLVAAGGHNVLEPAALGIPVLVGPHVSNCAELVAGLEAVEGLVRVTDTAFLAQAVADLLGNKRRRLALGERARQQLEVNKGATQRLYETIHPLLTEPPATIGLSGNRAGC